MFISKLTLLVMFLTWIVGGYFIYKAGFMAGLTMMANTLEDKGMVEFAPEEDDDE